MRWAASVRCCGWRYAAVAVILAYTHYLGFLELACQALYSAFRFRTNKPAFCGYALVVLSYVPWVDHLRQQLPLGGLTLSRPGFDAGLAASLRDAFAMGAPGARGTVELGFLALWWG